MSLYVINPLINRAWMIQLLQWSKFHHSGPAATTVLLLGRHTACSLQGLVRDTPLGLFIPVLLGPKLPWGWGIPLFRHTLILVVVTNDYWWPMLVIIGWFTNGYMSDTWWDHHLCWSHLFHGETTVISLRLFGANTICGQTQTAVDHYHHQDSVTERPSSSVLSSQLRLLFTREWGFRTVTLCFSLLVFVGHYE